MRQVCLAALALLFPGVAAAERPLHLFHAVAIAPDGLHVASIEYDDVATDSEAPYALVIRDLAGRAAMVHLPCKAGPDCKPASPVWSHDSTRLSFIIEGHHGLTAAIETVALDGRAPQRVLSFNGPLEALRYGPGDRLAVLATANAHKRVGRAEAAAALTGDVGDAVDEQRIATVEGSALHFVSPPDLYVYEYDWRPDGGFVGTAAAGDGDSHWWVARLYAFEPDGAVRVLFAPGPREQLAAPSVSPDGAAVAFIGGWMSDFGSTGGDAYLLKLREADAAPTDLTAGALATVTALDWQCGAGTAAARLTATTLAGDTVALVDPAAPGSPPLWSGQTSLSAGGWNQSVSCGPHGSAAIAESFTAPPELVAGPIGHWRAITHVNAGLAAPLTARSVTWSDDGLHVQGWLLRAAAGGSGSGPAARHPLIVDVHGGPQAAVTPEFPHMRDVLRDFLAQGWDVFEPNYRGSFGQGEAFAAASIQDLGGGDWRDVLSGVDAVERLAPIDDSRLGITGHSYGGYMTMWAVTQTRRFRAGMAGAGVSDWLSLEGEAPQAGSDEVSFGGSVYDDPTAYLRASPVTHMRGVRTPVLIAVGERDAECPMPQSQEFDTALRAAGVPADFVVYAGEGHGFRLEADRADLRRRTVAWFQRWFKER